MADNFDKSVVNGILTALREVNKLEKEIDNLIEKIENNKLNNQKIISELKKIRHKIWGMN